MTVHARAVADLWNSGRIYALAPIITGISVFFTVPAVTRVLEAPQFGVVTLCLVAGQFISMLANLGLPAAVTRAFFLDAGAARSALRISLEGSAFAVASIGLLITIGSYWWPAATGLPWGAQGLFAITYGGLLAVTALGTSLLRAMDRPLAFVLTTVITAIGGPVLGLCLLLTRGQTTSNYLAGLSIAGSISVLVAFGSVLGRTREPRTSKGFRSRALAIALPTIPHLLALQGFYAGLRILVNHEEGSGAVAHLQVCFTVGSLGIMLLTAFNNAWAPQIYRANSAERAFILQATTRAVTLAALSVALLTVLLSPVLLDVMAPPEYIVKDSLMVTAIFAASCPAYVRYLSYMHLVFVKGNTRALAVLTPLCVVASLGIALLLAKFGAGLMSYAAAAVALHLLTGSVAGLLAQRTAVALPNVIMSHVATAAVLLVGWISSLAPSGAASMMIRLLATFALCVVSYKMLSFTLPNVRAEGAVRSSRSRGITH